MFPICFRVRIKYFYKSLQPLYIFLQIISASVDSLFIYEAFCVVLVHAERFCANFSWLYWLLWVYSIFPLYRLIFEQLLETGFLFISRTNILIVIQCQQGALVFPAVANFQHFMTSSNYFSDFAPILNFFLQI